MAEEDMPHGIKIEVSDQPINIFFGYDHAGDSVSHLPRALLSSELQVLIVAISNLSNTPSLSRDDVK